jgi:hypothetical protein
MRGLPFRLLEGSGALCLAMLAGCGGRSATLDTDAFSVEANQPSASGSNGKGTGSASATGAGSAPNSGSSGIPSAGGSGTPSSGSGGTSSGSGAAPGSSAGSSPNPGTWTGRAGSSSAGGAPSGGPAGGSASGGAPTVFLNSCADYCSTTMQGVCPSQIPLDECQSSCASELSNQSLQCQRTASALLDCLTTVYRNSSNCADVAQLSVAKCAELEASYVRCSGPATNPVPTPAPQPPIPVCSSSGNSGNGACSLDVKCTNGTYYSVACRQTSPTQSSCSCSSSSSSGSASSVGLSLNESITFACYDSLAVCGFPQIGAK